MSARFKKSPISTRSFNKGFRIFSKAIIEPSLHITSAVAKNAIKSESLPPAKKSTLSSTVNSTVIQGNPAAYPNQSIFDIRKRGLDQVQFINGLYYNTPRPICEIDIEGILSKYSAAANQYLNKGVKCGYDCYAFAASFFTQQAQNAKKEKTRNDYNAALSVLPFFKEGKNPEEIMNAIVSQADSQQTDEID